MVKKFRRAAAGLEEQLPSDLRPPPTLSKTCDYLFNDILTEHDLGKAHKFLWDRTRAVRNDFTIQQCTKTPDIRIQIECFERIARFHILSLHQLAVPKEEQPSSYDRHQDREQLDKTLLSLLTLYDTNRARYRSPSEPEFRAYCILFQMQALVPDIEDRIQSWPPDIVKNPRVQTALKIYAAAADVLEPLGPLNPRTCHPIAQTNTGKFFKLVKSSQVSYLMACVAEMEFNAVRKAALHNIWKAYRIGAERKVEDWTLPELTRVLAFDDDEETREFCEAYGFSIMEKADGNEFLDITSVQGRQLPDSSPNLRKQFRSETVVEPKRHYRSYSAIISGLTVKQAKERGMMEEYQANGDQPSLFVNQDSESDTETTTTATSSFTPGTNPFAAAAAATTPKNPFAPAAPAASSAFGKPAGPAPQATAFGAFGTPSNQGSTTSTPVSTKTNPFSPSSTASTAATTPALGVTSSPFQPGPSPAAAPSPFAQSSPFQIGAQTTPFSAWGQPPPPQKSTTPTSSFEQPSDTPPGSPPKSSGFGVVTSSAQAPSTTLFPLTTAGTPAADKSKQPEQAPRFSPVNPPADENQKPSPASSSIFGFPPVSTKSSAPASSPFAFSESSAGKNPFGFSASQLPGLSPAQSLAPESGQAATPFSLTPTTTPNTSLDSNAQALKPSLGAFNPSKFSAPTSTAETTFTPQPTLSTPQEPPNAHVAQSVLPSFTPASSFTPGPASFHPPKSSAPAPPNFTPTASFAPAPSTAQAPKAVPPPSVPNALLIAEENARKEKEKHTAQVIDNVTESLVLEPKAGLLAQFIEHMAQGIVIEALQEFELEQDRKRADEFRAKSLAIRYLRLWKHIWWTNHLRRRGRERRKARRTALNAAASQRGPKRVEADVRDFKSTMGSSLRKLAASNGVRSDGDFRGSFSSSIGVHDLLEKDRLRRPTSSQKESYMMSGALSSTGRRSSTQSDTLGPNQDNFRISKLKKAPLQPPQLSRYRASFLSGQPLIPKESTYTGRISTTQGDYFRLKALGINYDDVYGDKNSRKRYRAFDEDEEAIASSADSQSVSPPERKRRTAKRALDNYRLSQSRTPGEDRDAATATSAPSISAKHDDVDAADDALIARFRAIKKSLNDSADFYRSAREQIQQEDSESIRSSSADPLARSYTSFRASHFPQAPVASASLPKYWSRESRFLPRSEYGGARWLANKQDKGKERAAESSQRLVKPHSEARLPTQSSTTLKSQSSMPGSVQQMPSSRAINSQESSMNPHPSFAPGGRNQPEAMPASQSFSSVVPDSNPFVMNQATPNGAGSAGDEIMILSSDDEDGGNDVMQSQIPVKSKEVSIGVDDDDDMLIIENEHDGSVAEDSAPQYAQQMEFGSQFEEQYQCDQPIETFEEESSVVQDEVDPALLDEDDESREQERGSDESEDSGDTDDEDDGLEDDESMEDEEIIEDDYLDEEDSRDDDSEGRGATPSVLYKDKGNSFEDAIEL